MKKNILLLIFLISLPLHAITGDNFEEVDGRGLAIRTNPQGVRIFIDGVERGITPAVFENLVSGEHHIRLSREGFKDRNFNVTLFNTSRLVVSIEMEEARGIALVSIYKEQDSPLPFNPQIFANASSINENKNELSLPLGYNTIRVRAFGWEDASVTVLVDEHATAAADILMRPAAFKMENASVSRRRFNPLNSGQLGITEYRFEVTAASAGALTIRNSQGITVYTEQLKPFDTWVQHVTWNGRDEEGNPLPQGIYTVLIEAETVSLKMETEISYSVNTFPLSLSSGISGLVFSPMPHVLPAGSYQFNAGILCFTEKKINADKSIFNPIGFPFKIGMRVSPLEKLELATVFNINPYLHDHAGWGVGGSVKYNFLKGPFLLSAAGSYSWADSRGEYPLSAGKGAGFHLPLSYEFKLAGSGAFSFVLCPALFWKGPQGLSPEFLLSAGLLYHGSFFNAGLSARYEQDFTFAENRNFHAGAEAHIFPAPSNLVFSLKAGTQIRKEQAGLFGYIGMGLIY
ncbi:MAG: PEGA domain-containing protein [Treponema sp.]|nr:PEGA domain-containing protein [Treponema sp.]